MKILAPFLVILCFYSSKVFTQDDITKTNDTIDYSVLLKDYVISANYKPTLSRESVYQVNSISKEEIAKKNISSLDELLSQLSSFRILYDPILGTKISLRGIGSENVAILQDGIPIIGRLDGSIDISQINLDNIERIEIISGPQSVIYGNNAAGGIINLITKKSQLEKYQISLDANQSLPKRTDVSLNSSFNVNKLFLKSGISYLTDMPYKIDSLRVFEDFELNSQNTIKRKKYPWNPKERINGYFTARYFLNETNSISFQVDGSSQNIENFGEKRRPNFLPYALDEQYYTVRKNGNLRYEGLFNRMSFEAILARNDYNRILSKNRFDFTSNQNENQFSTKDSIEFIAYFGKIVAVYSIDKTTLSIGSQFDYQLGTGDRLSNNEEPFTNIVESQELSFFSDLRHELKPNFKTSISARLTSNKLFGNQLSPSFQAIWTINKNFSFRGGFARGFRSPDLKELYINFIDVNHFVLGNTDLRPELTNDFNLSMDYQKNKNKHNLLLRLNFYFNKIKQKIVLAQLDQLQYQYINLESYSVFGLNQKFEFAYKNITISNDYNLGFWNNIDSEQPEIPTHSLVVDNMLNINYELLWNKVNVSLTHRYAGKVPRYFLENNQLNQSVASPYQFIDFYTNVLFLNGNLSIKGGVQNILNIQYNNVNNLSSNSNHSSDISSSQLVARGRTFHLGIRYIIKA